MFSIHKISGKARLGTLNLKHGFIETPVFMPVATKASVKTLTSQDLEMLKYNIILCNTYHLFLRPGLDIIKNAGSLHKFMNWSKPILTDSGGFQVFSLAKRCKITEAGASFQSHIDGSFFQLTPEKAVRIQEILGSDIHMVFDECSAFPISYEEASDAMQRSMRWAKRSKNEQSPQSPLYQFGIVQGSVYKDLREESCRILQDIGFDGYAIGGLSVGEDISFMRDMTEICCNHLPTDKPRYLMGVGTPLDLIESVALGVDMFDCVMPTRNARNGGLFTSQGKLTIRNARHRLTSSPIDKKCSCLTCRHYSLSYLHHLYKCGELSVYRLLTIHNLCFYFQFMQKIRDAIREEFFEDFLLQQKNIWKKT